MRRREFLGVLGVAAAAWPLSARAQQSKTVGWLTVSPVQGPIDEAFHQGLRERGYIDGENIIIKYRAAAKNPAYLETFASEFVSEKVDVIFAAGSQATRTAQRKTTTIPIVMTSTNPVGLGFVQSLARPGGNITGLSILGPEVSGKRLELLRDLNPGISQVTLLWNPDDPGAKFSLEETKEAAERLGFKFQIFQASQVSEFDGVFLAASRQGSQAVVLLPAPLMSRNASQIADLALKHRLPTLFYSEDSVKNGGLISYGASLADIYRRAAYYVDRILKGAHPADLPVEQPTKFVLALNLRTARSLGLAVPPTLLARADEVIE